MHLYASFCIFISPVGIAKESYYSCPVRKKQGELLMIARFGALQLLFSCKINWTCIRPLASVKHASKLKEWQPVSLMSAPYLCSSAHPRNVEAWLRKQVEHSNTSIIFRTKLLSIKWSIIDKRKCCFWDLHQEPTSKCFGSPNGRRDGAFEHKDSEAEIVQSQTQAVLAFERLGNAAPCDTKSSVQRLTEPDRRRSSCHALESSIA